MNKWDKRYLDLALEVASWSKDPSTKVGCVIIDSFGRPVSFGFNGLPREMGDTDERLNDRTFKYAHTTHGEINAVLAAGRHLNGCTVYITHPPCSMCLCQLKQAFVDKIVCYDGGKDFQERWNTDSVLKLADELKISINIYEKND